jgi:hypothetical protein
LAAVEVKAPLVTQERFFSRWPRRTWLEAVWTAAILGVLIFVEVSIAETEDAFSLNELFEFTAFVAGLIIWGIGFRLIRLLAGLVAWREHEAAQRRRLRSMRMRRKEMNIKP